VRAALLFFLLPFAGCALAQSAPGFPGHPWHSAEEQRVEADARNFHDSRFNIDPTRTYSLAELVDLAEAHNPETRVAWERARAQAAALGVARSELYPTLAAAVLSETSRSNVLFGNEFFPQTIQDFEVDLELNYTVFDFGARSGRIDAAKAKLLAANFAFNNTHRNVIYQVEQAYYRLLSSVGQEDAARASLANAQAVQQDAEERLAHGLATLPTYWKRGARRHRHYDLQAILVFRGRSNSRARSAIQLTAYSSKKQCS
jgi:outer membrane protein TolC